MITIGCVFCCFVQILSYDTVREGKAKLQIRPQYAKKSRFKDLSVKDKRHVHGHSRVFSCLQVSK